MMVYNLLDIRVKRMNKGILKELMGYEKEPES